MTGKSRDPQVPSDKRTTAVRQQTGWQDSSWGRMHGNTKEYDRLPTPPAPSPAEPCNPTSCD